MENKPDTETTLITPKIKSSDLIPQNIPPEIAADPRAKELYIKAFGIVKKTPGLSSLSASKRCFWIYGFMNGVEYGKQEQINGEKNENKTEEN